MFFIPQTILIGVIPMIKKISIGIDDFTGIPIELFSEFQKQAFEHGIGA